MTVLSIDDITEDNLPPVEISTNPERGTKVVVQHYFNEDGDLIKETKEYRTEKRLVASQIAVRKKWAKYGAAKNDPPGGNSANTYPAEMVTMQLVQARQPEQEQERQEEESLKAKPTVQTARCRYCKGSHFSHKCPNKSDMEAMQALREKLKGKIEGAEEPKEIPEPVVSTGRYLPPRFVPGAAAASVLGSSMGTEKRSFDGHTVRVTNLQPDTTADDLKQIFSPFGAVTRIYPAKDKVTQQNRGFAFISYATAEEATAAIYGVNGLRHNHVVLKVDWAKPSAN
uniref:Eukaryotic translation initiation factor 3 subunit G n=1 Tax=Clonorchis sinensis TaxID=79923 RepID=F2VT60_CLOSI|nr:subunit delta of eukaryotic translation initiation factor 3 [Clonorchis sinensis]